MDRLWVMLEDVIERRRLPDRTIYALADAAVGMRVRNATYRSLAEVSKQVATRDFQQLVAAGLLVPKGERRARHYVASGELLRLRVQTREPRSVSDPFSDQA
jgi:hypothetical protein